MRAGRVPRFFVVICSIHYCHVAVYQYTLWPIETCLDQLELSQSRRFRTVLMLRLLVYSWLSVNPISYTRADPEIKTFQFWQSIIINALLYQIRRKKVSYLMSNFNLTITFQQKSRFFVKRLKHAIEVPALRNIMRHSVIWYFTDVREDEGINRS